MTKYDPIRPDFEPGEPLIPESLDSTPAGPGAADSAPAEPGAPDSAPAESVGPVVLSKPDPTPSQHPAPPPPPIKPMVSSLGTGGAEAARRWRLVGIAAATAVVVVAAVVVAWVVLTKVNKSSEAPYPRPPGAQEDGGLLIGRDMIPGGQAPAEDEAVTVHLVTDFLCPWCGRFEKNQASALSDMARAGEIRLVVHPVAYLSGWNDEYSLRALTAVATVAYLQPEKYMDFSAALWEAQPGESENGEDLTDERIRQIAIDAGVTNAVANTLTIGGSPVAEWADWASEQGLDMIEGTPTIFMSYAGSEPAQWKGWLIRTTDSNGNEVMLRGDLAKAVANVKAGKDPSGG